jgi:hypothetical protein
MNLFVLIAIVVLCIVAVYYGKQLPAPWPTVIIAVIVILCVAAILSLLGWLPGTPLVIRG